MRRGLIAFFLLLMMVAAVVGGAVFWGYRAYIGPGPLRDETAVVILPGSSTETIAARLTEAGVIDNPLVFRVGVRLEGSAAALRAGEYAFPPGVSLRQAAAILRSGKTVVRRLTVPEGLTSKQVVTLVEQTPGLFGDLPPTPAEGSLLPETYHFSYGDSRQEVLSRMGDAMTEALATLWKTRSEDLPLESPEEAVTLASIVEKESALPEERPRVAAVFINRLRRGMPLQADPTVIYAVTEGTGVLSRPLTQSDLDSPSPYNTYVNSGLPPGPIANPGREALRAVLQPADTQELYFVADGSGGHAFARTLQEHNRNVARWRRLQNDKPANGLAPASR